MIRRCRARALGYMLLSTLVYAQAVPAQQTSPDPKAEAALGAQPASPVQPLYATVDGKPITQDEFHAAYANFLRQKFYHGQVPQDQLLQARKDVSDQLVNRILFLAEIERRGIKPDAEDVDRRVQAYDQRYANSPAWQKNRETLLPGLREQLNQQSQTTRLEQAVKNVPLPTADEARAFYDTKPELFTEPEKLRLHSILLGVDPSSPRPVWDAALREAEAIVRRIRAGADFGEQARLFSRDGSGEKGGDMGYLHLGMLPDNLQTRIDQFKLGEVADPLEMLQGVGIFRLDERVAAKLQPFDSVAVRAGELLQRERQEKAWMDFLAKMRSEAKIVIYEAFTPPPANQSAVGK